MAGFAILLAFNVLGIILNQFLALPLPANVIGLILFTVCLYFKWIKLEWVEQTANFLLRHLMLFFAPVIVGTIAFQKFIRAEWLSIVGGLLLSTFAVLAVTGWITQWCALREEESSRG